MAEDQVSDLEPTGHAALALAEAILTVLIAKDIISLEQAKNLLLSISASMSVGVMRTGEAGKVRQASAFKEMESLLMSFLETLDATFGRQPD